ncbi:MAG: 3-phosphoserine/phosphohydroxythreonine transaminase [Flavobacteriales bacterium]|nr:3-phosphoserine/phosphohydroxythreonine transaminase [Flavobacteriales bacterium]
MAHIHNFSAGPSILPKSVFEEASRAVVDFNGSGLSILEMSHRSKDFVAVMDEARSLVKEILGLGDDYDVLFLQGGASTGFLISAYNMLRENNRGGYINTGSWANKAVKEGKWVGDALEVASSKEANYNFIPKGYESPTDVDYLHYTSNNTIFGTQYHHIPDVTVPLVCDMSSDIFSRPIDASKFDLIYAGAQKNMGPAGTTVYIFKKEILGKSSADIPTMLNLKTHADKDSMFNTPPVFPVYVSMLVLRWIKSLGLEEVGRRNEAKANLLYGEVERNGMFKATAALEDRSWTNGTFVLADGIDEGLNQTFLDMAAEANISGIKGHRSVGGFRASMYNALPIESVGALVDVMKAFEEKYG